jgi:thiol:disulfide interchange protein
MLHPSRIAFFALLLSGAVGCASRRSMDAVWAMPEGARPSDGYPFSYAAGSGRGGDALDGAYPGDLPETGYAARHGMWRDDERATLVEARELGFGRVVSFWAEWCDDCLRLDQQTFRDPQVVAAIEAAYVPLRVDATEETFAVREQLERHQVNRLPTLILFDAQGREIDRVEGFVSSHDLLERWNAATHPASRELAGKTR